MPRINVRLFAGLHQLVGERELSFEMPPGATIDTLRAQLLRTYPIVEPFMSTLVCAVDEEYVVGDHVLRDGDHVALIPPVSGGC